MAIGIGEQFYDFESNRLDDAPGTSASGVFVLFRGKICIYVGQSLHVRNTLEKLLAGENECVATHKPKQYQYQVYPPFSLTQAFEDLLQKYTPECH